MPLFEEAVPPSELYSAILLRIMRERRSTARVRLAVFGALTFVCVLLLIPAVGYAMSEFYTSGFYEYASLLFDSLSRGYSGELLYALADSLPSLSILLLTAIGAALVWFFIRAKRDVRIVFTRVPLLV